MKRAALSASVVLAILPWVLGCGDQKKTAYKASGVATYDDNTPVKNVRLNFFPASGTVAEGESLPRADTDENGKFTVSTYGDGDGAPAGEYKVTLSQSAGMMKPGKPGEPVEAAFPRQYRRSARGQVSSPLLDLFRIFEPAGGPG